MRSPYLKKQVQPVVAKKISAREISITYSKFAESIAYSKGINYEVKEGILFVSIDRCFIGENCHPTVEQSPINKEDIWKAEVTLPYSGEKIVMRYADMDEELPLEELPLEELPLEEQK